MKQVTVSFDVDVDDDGEALSIVNELLGFGEIPREPDSPFISYIVRAVE